MALINIIDLVSITPQFRHDGMGVLARKKMPWEDVDMEAKVLTVRADIAKNGNEHRLPLSDFLQELMRRRYSERGESEWVFQGRDKKRI